MKSHQANSILPVHDYSGAIQVAVSWLGERYLLAVPVAARQRRRPVPTFLLRTTPWLPTDTHRR
jgi:hypothetical protein